MGSRREARIAGATPKITPIKAENPDAKNIDQYVTDVCINVRRANDPAIPRSIPIIPPTRLKITASIKN